MKLTCPKISCPNPKSLRKDGRYFRKNDSKFIQRYRCSSCETRLSSSLMSPCYRQKKRTINKMVESLYCSKVSMRRIAKILRIDKKTVARKVIFLGIQAKIFNQAQRKKIWQKPIEHLQFDDLITKERTKLLPLSVTGLVDADSRKILALEVSTIGAFGHLARLSRKKYGKRENTHQKILDRVFAKNKEFIDSKAVLRSDEHQFYQQVIKKHLPNCTYQQFKSEKSTVAGQGELKRKARDPIYAINHTFAMMRDNISRLVRRSWCVTQDPKMLQHHLEIYIKYHNTQLV